MSRLSNLMVVVLHLGVAAAAAADLSGTWVTEVDSPYGAIPYTFELKLDGDTVTGTASSRFARVAITDGKLEDGVLSFVETLVFGGVYQVRLEYSGMVVGEELRLIRNGGFGGVALVARRPAEDSGTTQQEAGTPVLSEPFQDSRLQIGERVDNLLSLLTLEEKLAMLRQPASLSRLGVRGSGVVEASHGVAMSEAFAAPLPGVATTGFPQTVGMAATWNPELLQKVGEVVATEARYLFESWRYYRGGVLVALGSDAAYGEEPLLARTMLEAFCLGLHGATDGFWLADSLPEQELLRLSSLATAAEEGRVGHAEVDQALQEFLPHLFRLGLFEQPSSLELRQVDRQVEPWERAEHRAVARTATQQSVVLLQNEGGLLPLDATTLDSVAIIGPHATEVVADCSSGTPPYVVTPLAGIRRHLGERTRVSFAIDNTDDAAVVAAANAQVAIVVVGSYPECERELHEALTEQEQAMLVHQVVKVNPRTILVLVTDRSGWLGQSMNEVGAALTVANSSQELGSAIADVLFGAVNPAGRLAQTWRAPETGEVVYPFGHGLSYTEFVYKDLEVDAHGVDPDRPLQVRLTVDNTGHHDGDEVVQLYLRSPSDTAVTPSLGAFRRLSLAAGEEQSVELAVQPLELQRALEPGSEIIEVLVGASRGDIRLRETRPLLDRTFVTAEQL